MQKKFGGAGLRRTGAKPVVCLVAASGAEQQLGLGEGGQRAVGNAQPDLQPSGSRSDLTLGTATSRLQDLPSTV